ncbi:hypothetical protein BUALT_Bualt14G0098100 [Buddleja alternifolia]|uniref:DUF4005 domain-containing protein n=1 Tax=Buddleja alternifolia TaxID=168488 RepID=A0AAV6WPB5_9LAMI|nr:hypothetical protein BUALT_Bualt14G0098100 [Buddleja alternifolia]
MSRDNWERLVGAVIKREELRHIALCPSIASSSSADLSARLSVDSFLEDESVGKSATGAVAGGVAARAALLFAAPARAFALHRRRKQRSHLIDFPGTNNGNEHFPATPQPTTPREKRWWSFRRSSATGLPRGRQELSSVDNIATTNPVMGSDDTKKHAVAAAEDTTAAADAAVAAAVIQPTAAYGRGGGVEESAAIMVQCVFRGYLARKALNALKGLVKLQALVRGHLVRKQAKATFRCMQSLLAVQARARAQRLRMAEETNSMYQRQYNHIKSTNEIAFRNSNQNHRTQNLHAPSIHQAQNRHQISLSPSAITDMSLRTGSNHFDEDFLGTTQSRPQCYSALSKPDPATLHFSYPRSEYTESLYCEYQFYPNYMASTESSRAKVRSHSAPKQRPVETVERQLSRRKLEGRNVPRAIRMQRSSSIVGSTAQNYQYPWSVKLDRSAVSLMDSECGSSSTMVSERVWACVLRSKATIASQKSSQFAVDRSVVNSTGSLRNVAVWTE